MSIEKFNANTRTGTQIIYLITVVTFHSLSFLPVVFKLNLKSDGLNSSNLTCNFIDEYSRQLVNYIDIINRITIP